MRSCRGIAEICRFDMHGCMNWKAINFDWNQGRAFLATVEEGTLSAAARALGQTQPTVGRQVAALEEHLGVTLFERSGRSLQLTPAGIELADHVRAMGEAATRVSLAATGQSTSVEGLVRVSATEMYSAFLLPKIVARLRKRHPGIVLEIVATNSLSDLRHREADIAIRNTEPTDPDMIARRMPDDLGALYVAKSLGAFTAPEDARDAPFIGFNEGSDYLSFLQQSNLPVTDKNFVVTTKNHLVHWSLARAGLGIGMTMVEVGDTDDQMVRAFPWLKPVAFPVWLVAPRELKTSRRVRIVYDCIADICEQRRVKPP